MYTAQKISPLDSVFPEYEPISRAPTMAKLEAMAEERQIPVWAIVEEERAKRYKSLHSPTGGIYLVQNPAVWRTEGKAVVMIAPQLIGSIHDARGGGRSSKGRGNVSDCF